MAKIQTITAKDTNNNSAVFDLDNRYIEISGTSGTLTTDQLAILQASNQNYIINGGYVYRQTFQDSSTLAYKSIANSEGINKYITITISSGAYVQKEYLLTEVLIVSTSDTPNRTLATTIIAAFESGKDVLVNQKVQDGLITKWYQGKLTHVTKRLTSQGALTGDCVLHFSGMTPEHRLFVVTLSGNFTSNTFM